MVSLQLPYSHNATNRLCEWRMKSIPKEMWSGKIGEWRDGWMSGQVICHITICAAGQGGLLYLWWWFNGGPAVVPPLVVVVGRKNRRKCNFFIFLPFFDSSRLSMAPSSEGWFVQSLISKSHGWLLVLFSEVCPKMVEMHLFVPNNFNSRKWPKYIKTHIKCNKWSSDSLNSCD